MIANLRWVLRMPLRSVGFTAVVAVIASASTVSASEIREVERPVLSAAFTDCMRAVSAANDRSSAATLSLLERALEQVSAPYERYQLIFRELAFRYAESKEWQRLFDLVRRGQAEGLFYPFLTGERTWPAYVAELSKLPGFGDFMKENDRLRAEAQKNARLEYFVEKPASCTLARRCPLVFILHGGVGSHAALAESWHSPRLASDFIVVRVQGAECRGSFSRAYADDGFVGIVAVYRQVLDRHPVDASRTVLAGQSNGGRAAILLATTGKIAAQGLILAFPTKPQNLDELEVRRAAQRGLRAVLLCGEKDWAIGQQRELGALFDRCALPNRLLVSASKGHEFPEDFPAHLDRSLEFVLGLSWTTTSDRGRK